MKYILIDSALVDGEQWYTIEPRDADLFIWITQQERHQWVSHTVGYAESTKFLLDIDEQLYTLMVLRWA
jgi:hypothetical protein